MYQAHLIIEATPDALTESMNNFFASKVSLMFKLIKVEVTQVMLGFNKIQQAPVMGLAATLIYEQAEMMAPIGDSQE